MYTPDWIRAIQANNRKRRVAYDACFKNLKRMKAMVIDLANWKQKSVEELEEMLKELRQGHLVLLVDKMTYLATLRFMGTLENIIYTPEVHRQQREQDEAMEALEQMINTTSEVVIFLKKYNETGLTPKGFKV